MRGFAAILALVLGLTLLAAPPASASAAVAAPDIARPMDHSNTAAPSCATRPTRVQSFEHLCLDASILESPLLAPVSASAVLKPPSLTNGSTFTSARGSSFTPAVTTGAHRFSPPRSRQTETQTRISVLTKGLSRIRRWGSRRGGR